MTLLRYPGGKSRGPLSQKILETIRQHYTGGSFVEPFFGGGAISLKLLESKSIERLVVAEKDRALLALWKQVRQQPHRLINYIKGFKPAVRIFLEAKDRILWGNGTGFDALVVNRLSHGGRGVMAGPQGGLKQTGKYKIGCRWNPDKLCSDVLTVSDLLNSVEIAWYEDYQQCRGSFYYVDPPYWEVGQGLYLHSFSAKNHCSLRVWLDERSPWILSYNNHSSVVDLYVDYYQEIMDTSGNGGQKAQSELLIYNLT